MADYPTSPKPYRFNYVAYEYKTKIFESENSSEQRRSTMPIQRRYYTLEYECIYSDFSTMKTFFDSKYGSANSFTFNPYVFDTNLENENIDVRFVSDDLQVDRVISGVYKFKLEMVEWLNA